MQLPIASQVTTSIEINSLRNDLEAVQLIVQDIPC